MDEPWHFAADKILCDGTATTKHVSLERVAADERFDGGDQ
jgi:hypothetical protein